VRGRLRAGAAVLALALALGLAACSGGEGSAETVASTGEAPATSVRVEVRDGDTGAPVEGATVVATGAGGVSGTTSADGIAVLDGSPRAVRAKAAGMGTAVARVRDGVATVDLYDPDLQSPQYGGDTARTRYVPDVAAPPPSGPPAWRFDGRTLIEFPPVVDDGLVVFGTNSGRVFALDADTGDVRWARRVKGQIASSPAIDGDTVLVSDMGGTLTAYARAGGKPLWTYSTAGSPIESSPLVADGIAYIGDWSGTLHAVDVADGSAVWTYRASADIKGSAALAGDAVVVGDYAGVIHSVDAKTGAVRWTSSAGQRFYGGPGVSNGTIVIGDVGGAVIGLSAADGAVRWRHSTGGAYVYSSPAIADGRVFIGSYNGAFQALDLDDGSVVWTHDAGGRISGSATVVDGVVYTAILYAPGQARRTWGLDVATGAVRYRGDDGRYSPAVGAGDTLYLVGTRLLYAYPAPNRGRT
jgi:outer membrane protein assembly factor BamB